MTPAQEGIRTYSRDEPWRRLSRGVVSIRRRRVAQPDGPRLSASPFMVMENLPKRAANGTEECRWPASATRRAIPAKQEMARRCLGGRGTDAMGGDGLRLRLRLVDRGSDDGPVCAL